MPGSPVIAVLVLPLGAFSTTSRELEAALGSRGDRFPAWLHVTEDYAAGWSRAFAAPEGPSTFLLNAKGEFVWKHDGALDAERLAGALDEFLLPAPPPQNRVMRLTLESGQAVPDFVLTDVHGTQIPMRRLRRRPLLLTFWQS